MQPSGGGAELGGGARSLRVQRGIGPRTVSGKTHSVIGVSANTQGGAEDWTDDFDLAPATTKMTLTTGGKPPSPAPHSPLAAAYKRIAQGESDALSRRHNRASITTTSVRKSSSVAASGAPSSSSAAQPAAPLDSQSLQAAREPLHHRARRNSGTAAAVVSSVPNRNGSSSASNSIPPAAVVSMTSSISRRQRQSSSHSHHKDSGTDYYSGSRHSNTETGSRSSSHRRRHREDSGTHSTGTKSSSARTPTGRREEGGHHGRARRSSRAESSRSSNHSSARREGIGESAEEVDEAVPKRRRSRDEHHRGTGSSMFSSRSNTSGVSTRKKDPGGGGGNGGSRDRTRGERLTPRQRKELVDAIDDSPTDSDALPAPQMRALRTAPQVLSTNDRILSADSSVPAPQLESLRGNDRRADVSSRRGSSHHRGSSAVEQLEDDSEGPVQIPFLDGLPEHTPGRAEVVSPSQSAFGLRMDEDEGEAGEGEAPLEDEEDDFEGSDLEGDWDTEMGLMEPVVYTDLAERLNPPSGGGGPAGGRRGGSGGGGAEPSPVSIAAAGAFGEAVQPSEAGGSSDRFSDARAPTTYSSLAGASGSDEVDTDWDREFFGAGKNGETSPNDARDVTRANIAKGLRGLLGGATSQHDSEDARTGRGGGEALTGVPDKCRVVGRLLRGGRAGAAVTIVKYPRACHLICLRVGAGSEGEEAGGASVASPDPNIGGSSSLSVPDAFTPSSSLKGQGRAMHGQRMVEWLECLISKRAGSYRSKSELTAANSRLVKGLQVMEKKKLNSQNTKVFLECSISTWRLNERENCVSVLKSYFHILRMQSRTSTRKSVQGLGSPSATSDTGHETYIMFRHTLKMLEIASLLLKPDSSLWLLRMQLGNQSHHIGAGAGRSSRGIFGDMLRIACSTFPAYREAFSLVELRAAAHHLGDIVDAGGDDFNVDESGSDSGNGDFTASAAVHGYGRHGGRGGGGGGRRGGWGYGSSDDGYDDDDWGVEYSWSAQGGAGRHQAPTLVDRMPQAICTNYLRVYARAVRGGSENRSGWPGSGGVHRGSIDGRGGARSPALPSPNTLLLRSLSSSSAISRVSSHFSHFNSNAAPVELLLPHFGNRRNSGAGIGGEDDAGTSSRSGSRRDGNSSGTPSAGLDVRATRAKYLGTGAAGGAVGGNAGASAATAAAGRGAGGVAENASRASKSKTKWGWDAGKSLFGKRGTIGDGGKKSSSEHERVDPSQISTAPASAAGSGTRSTLAVAVAAEAAAAATAAAVNNKTGGAATPAENGGSREKSGGTGGNGSVAPSRSRDILDLRKTTDGVRPTESRTLATDSKRQGGRQQPGGEKERGRGSRSVSDQRSAGLDRESGGTGGGAGATRVRDARRPRQSRSVDSPGRLEKEACDAAAAAAAAHGFFSVPAASYSDTSNSRDSGSKSRQKEGGGSGVGPLTELAAYGRVRSASTENEDAALRDRNSRLSNSDRSSGTGESRVSTTGHASSYARVRDQQLYGDFTLRPHDFTESKRQRRPRVIEAGTRGERVSSRRPSSRSGEGGGGGGGGGGSRTRARSQDRIESGQRLRRDASQSQQWSDLASSTPRPPPPYPNSGSDGNTPSNAGGSRATGGGGGSRMMAASPANSSITTSDENSSARRLGTDEGTPSTIDFGASSLAGWGESMAAEAEAEVLGRGSARDRKYGGRGGGGRGGGECEADPTLRGQPERSRLHQMVAALTDLCMYLVGVSPLSMEDLSSMQEHLPNDDDDWDEDDTFEDSSLFSVGSQGSAYAAGFRRQNGSGAFPSSPSAIGAAENTSDDDFDDDDDFSSRWGTESSVIGGNGGKQQRSQARDHREMVGPSGDVVLVSDILKGWEGDGNKANALGRRSITGTTASVTESGGGGGARGSGKLRSDVGTDGSFSGRGSSGGSGEIGLRSAWRTGGNNGRSASGWSVLGGVPGPGGAGGVDRGGGRSIVSALERTMSRTTYGGGGGGGGKSGDRIQDPPLPQREKKRSEELFGTLMGQDSTAGRGGVATAGWGHGDGQRGGGAEGKEAGKNEVDLGFLHRSLRQPEDAGAYLELLLPAYKALPEECVQKARAAFAMGMLAEMKSDLDLAEALHLEAVLVLDRLPEEETGTCPLITPFGTNCLEKLGDVLLKNGKYEYGILALERATECYWEVSGRSVVYDRLIRRVTRITREHGDTKRALIYHSRMLQAAKIGRNLNEFVYLAKEISRMLKDEGWYLEAESYLLTTSRLLAGLLRLDKIVLRDRSASGVAPTAALSGDNGGFGNTWRQSLALSIEEGGGPLDGSDPGPAMVPVLDHVDAVVARAGAYSAAGAGAGAGLSSFFGPSVTTTGASGIHSSGMGISAVAGLSGVTVGNGSGISGGGSVTGSSGIGHSGGGGAGGVGGIGSTLAPVTEGPGPVLHKTPGRLRGSTVDAGGTSANDAFMMSYEFGGGGAATGAGGGGVGGGALSPTSVAMGGGAGGSSFATGLQGGGTAIETQQFELHMRMVDILTGSLQYVRALRLLNQLLRRKIKSGQRSLVLFKVARCYLKLRKVAACEAALERVVLEADEAVGSYASMGRATSDQPSTIPQHRRTTSGDRPGVAGVNEFRLNSAVLTANVTPMHGNLAWAAVAADRNSGESGERGMPSGGAGGGGGVAGTAGGGAALGGDTLGDKYVYEMVAMVKNVDFLVLRARCSLAAGDPVSALQWVGIALAVSTDSRQLGNEGRLMYLRGRCYQMLLLQTPEEDPLESSGMSDINKPVGADGRAEDKDGNEKETRHVATEAARCASKAEEAFNLAFEYFRSPDDVYHQAKSMARGVEMQLSRVFADVALRQVPMKEAAMGKGPTVVKGLEARAARSLGLAGDAGEPLLLALTLLNAAEVNWLMGRVLQSYQAWKEAAGLLSLIHLQRQEVAPAGPGSMSASMENYGTGTGVWARQGNGRQPGNAPAAGADGAGGAGTGGHGGGGGIQMLAIDMRGSGSKRSHRTAGTPLRAPASPTVSFPPSMMLKIHALLQRATRMAFVLSGPPPAHALAASQVLSNPLVAAALPNSTHLLAGWALLDGWVKLYPSQDKATHNRHHRRGGRRPSRTAKTTTTTYSHGFMRRTSRSNSPPAARTPSRTHAHNRSPPSPTAATDTEQQTGTHYDNVPPPSYAALHDDVAAIPDSNNKPLPGAAAGGGGGNSSRRGGGAGGDDPRETQAASGRDSGNSTTGTVDPAAVAAMTLAAGGWGGAGGYDERQHRRKASREAAARGGGAGGANGGAGSERASPFTEMSHMAPLAKPMAAPQPLTLMRKDRGQPVVLLARSSSLEGSTVSDALRSEGTDGWAPDGRKEGGQAQVRRRGHVRKRSEGSSFRGSEEASRRPGFAREKSSTRLVQAYGKMQEQTQQSRARTSSDRERLPAAQEVPEISVGVSLVSEDDLAKSPVYPGMSGRARRTNQGPRNPHGRPGGSRSPQPVPTDDYASEVPTRSTSLAIATENPAACTRSLSDSGSPESRRRPVSGEHADVAAKSLGRPARMSRRAGNFLSTWTKTRHSSPSGDRKPASQPPPPPSTLSGVTEVHETPQRRRATRSGVTPTVMSALAEPGTVGFSDQGNQRPGAHHKHTRSMSVSLEAVARAVHFSGMGKEVTQAVANARQAAANRERRGGPEASHQSLLRMNEFGMLTEVIPEGDDQDSNFDAGSGGGGLTAGGDGGGIRGVGVGAGGPGGAGSVQYQYGSRSTGGGGGVPQEQVEERDSARERHVELKPRRILVQTLLGKSHYPTTRNNRDRGDSQSWTSPDLPYTAESSVGTGGSNITGAGSSNIGGVSVGGVGGSGIPGLGGGGYGAYAGWGGLGGGFGGGWPRGYVGASTAGITPAQAGYGRGLTAGLELGMGGNRRALWTCFCSFKTRRKSYTKGALTLHDLHQENLGAMQRVVELGRHLGRPIFTSLWSSRADRPGVSSAPGSKGSLLHQPSRPTSLVDVTALGDSLGLGSSASTAASFATGAGAPVPRGTSAAAPRDTSAVDSSRDARRLSGRSSRTREGAWGGAGGRGASKAESGGSSGAIISEFALSALGPPGVGGGAGGGAAGAGGGRASPQPLSPTARAGPLPGSVLSSFASPASWRSSARSWQMFDEEMDGLDEDASVVGGAGGGGRSNASPGQNFRLGSESRRGRPSMLSQTVPVQRRQMSRGSAGGGGASTFGGSGGGWVGGGSSSTRSVAREEYLRRILQSRHPFPPHFHMLLFMDRSYLYYCPFTGDRVVLPVNGYGHPILPPPTKQLRVRPDGGMGPIPLHTGWTLGQVPQHIASWARASQRAAQAAADPSMDLSSSSTAAYNGRPRPGTEAGISGQAGGGPGGVVFGAAMIGGGGDPVLGSIAAGSPGAKLPLVPGLDETFVSRDTGVTVLVERLTPQFALFLVTALLMEQPVLLVADPGSDELLMHAASGLLRLIRPLQWQHLHVPLLPMSCQHVLRQAVDAKEPFLIGTYTSVLESVSRNSHGRRPQSNSTRNSSAGVGKGSHDYSPPPSETRDSSGGGGSSNIPSAALYRAHALSEGGQRHVTIADLSQGVVHPSKVLELAAACTLGPSVAVDTDPTLRSIIFSHFRGKHGSKGGGTDRGRTTGWGWPSAGNGAGPVDPGDYDTDAANASMAMLPPIPCRFRYQFAVRHESQLNGGETAGQEEGAGHVRGTKAKAKPTGGGGGSSGMSAGSGGVSSGAGSGGMMGYGDPRIDPATVINALLQSPVYTVGEGRIGVAIGERLHGNDEALAAAKSGEVLRVFMFGMMVSFLKGYHVFIRPPESIYVDEDPEGNDAAPAAMGGLGGGGGSRAGQGQESDVEFDVLGFLSFAKADLRPFLRVLLRTKAFASFLANSRQWSPAVMVPSAVGGDSASSTTAPTGPLRSVSSSVRPRRGRRDEPPDHPDVVHRRQRSRERAKVAGGSQSSAPASGARSGQASDFSAPADAAGPGRGSIGSLRTNTGGRENRDMTNRDSSNHKEEDRSGAPLRRFSGSNAGGTAGGAMDGFRDKLERAITARMQEQLHFHSMVGTERMGAFLLTYFTHSQNVAPPSAGDMGMGSGIGMASGSFSPTGGRGGGGISRGSLAGLRPSASRAPKVKRRWCVLDATRFTLFRTRSKTRVKGHVPLDPRAVALVTPPFTPSARGAGSDTAGGGGSKGGGGGGATNERDAVALVCFNMPPEIGTLVIRAEPNAAQEVWVRALAARLLSKDHHARMAELYGGGGEE